MTITVFNAEHNYEVDLLNLIEIVKYKELEEK